MLPDLEIKLVTRVHARRHTEKKNFIRDWKMSTMWVALEVRVEYIPKQQWIYFSPSTETPTPHSINENWLTNCAI